MGAKGAGAGPASVIDVVALSGGGLSRLFPKQLLVDSRRSASACFGSFARGSAGPDSDPPPDLTSYANGAVAPMWNSSAFRLSRRPPPTCFREFSTAFGISPATLRSWEQGRRQPTGAARVLLRVAAKHPKAVLEAVR